jgi:hypothetical protein
MTRRNRHVNRVAGSARIDHIIRESADGYFVARMTDGRVRVGLKGMHSVTSNQPQFQQLAEHANKLTDQEFHDACQIASDTAACPCPRCFDA